MGWKKIVREDLGEDGTGKDCDETRITIRVRTGSRKRVKVKTGSRKMRLVTRTKIIHRNTPSLPYWNLLSRFFFDDNTKITSKNKQTNYNNNNHNNYNYYY